MHLIIKPHHFLDLICDMAANNGNFEYLSPYGHGMHKCGNLLANGKINTITFTAGADDVCMPCIKLKDGICTDIFNEETTKRYGMDKKHDYNMGLDTRFINVLPDVFVPDTILNIDDVYKKLKDALTPEIILLNWPKDNRVELTIKGLKMAMDTRKIN